MKIAIEIECETIAELVQHLATLSSQVLEKAIKEKKGVDDEFTSDIGLDDANCYGEHTTTLIIDTYNS